MSKDNSILDRSGNFLKIFINKVEIDPRLPKWAKIAEEEVGEEGNPVTIRYKTEGNIFPESMNTQKFREILNMGNSDFNIYVGKEIAERIRNDVKMSYKNTLSLDGEFDTLVTPLNNRNVSETSEGSNKTKGKKVIDKFESFLGKILKKSKKKNPKEGEEYLINIPKFFELVKLATEEEAKTYVSRIKPYILMMERADEIGQTAMKDALAEKIFESKYESILYSKGFYKKIREEQVVDFVKKPEKGIQLCYLKNFMRIIPDNVFEKKKEADELLVFDNYCVMYYDNEVQSYGMTKEEKEKERAKKADPILFGVIQGSRNLYYIDSWIDEYCDLTLDEFIKVTGLDEKEIEIEENIKI